MTTAIIIIVAILYGVIVTIALMYAIKRVNQVSGELRSEMEKTYSLNRALDKRDKLIREMGRIENETTEKKGSYRSGSNDSDFSSSVDILHNLSKRSGNKSGDPGN